MTKINPVSPVTIFRHVKEMFHYHDHGTGLYALFSVILFLSFLAGIPIKDTPTLFIEGEIATEDIISDKDLMIEDTEATRNRQDQIRATQPLIFDINRENITHVRQDILEFLHLLSAYHEKIPSPVLMQHIEQFNRLYKTSLTQNTLELLATFNIHHYTLEVLLPWINRMLLSGVLDDLRLLNNSQSAIIIRNKEANTEILRTLDIGLTDMREFSIALGNKIRLDDTLNNKAKTVLIEILQSLLLPSLSINQDAYNIRVENLLRTIEPIFYYVSRGEVIVRAGDKVNRINQLKMQTLIDTTSEHYNSLYGIGVFILGIIFTVGLFMTPTGTRGRVLHNKDQLFMASTLLCTGICVFLIAHYLASTHDTLSTLLFPYAFPITGIAGLSVLIFSARRYCVFGLLISFYSTILFHGDIELFLFYFLISMISTFIILRTQNRQHVVLGTIPLIFSLFIVGIASAMMHGLELQYYPSLIVLLLINALLSMLILFAFSPVLEMLFGYTTRFKLMELLSLDHPLLQELMMKVPGTYHHALVVSNLVETAAKAINANSLLVKVGALYHDIGKLSRPDYFSENQFDGVNPHDNLSPAMSALILFAHVKHGTELAEAHNLGSEIIDMIQQHHGTRLPRFFYQKAVDLGENPKEADFQYPGPRPQSKEAAILMIADTVEAAIRSMGTPSPARIQTSVEALIKNIYAEAQLDETDLTFKDLNKLIESFTRAVTALYHQRIAYSDIKKQNSSEKNTPQNPTLAENKAAENNLLPNQQNVNKEKEIQEQLLQEQKPKDIQNKYNNTSDLQQEKKSTHKEKELNHSGDRS